MTISIQSKRQDPQLPDDGCILSELDHFSLYIDDEVIQHLIEATKQYAEKQ